MGEVHTVSNESSHEHDHTSLMVGLAEVREGLKQNLTALERVEARVARMNGDVARIKVEEAERRGAERFMRWALTTILALVMAGAAVAGVILMLVLQS